MDWIKLAQDRDRWWALVNVVMNLWVPENVVNFWNSWKPVSSSRSLLQGVSKYYFVWQIWREMWKVKPDGSSGGSDELTANFTNCLACCDPEAVNMPQCTAWTLFTCHQTWCIMWSWKEFKGTVNWKHLHPGHYWEFRNNTNLKIVSHIFIVLHLSTG